MAQDNRRVQTAVLGSPESDHPLSLPMDRGEARRYLAKYGTQRFFCGELLGGCGWRLMPKLYGDRICHFAHYPDIHGNAPVCQRRHLGADSADHLYIHRGLRAGLYAGPKDKRFPGHMVDGQCTDLLVRRSQPRTAVQVQFANLSYQEWEQEDEDLRSRLGHVDWMLGPRATRTAQYLLDRDGYALRVRCETVDGMRVVKVGTETADGDIAWCSLDECEISEQGLVTPRLKKASGTALRATTAAVRTPGFPLAVEGVIVRPREAAAKAIGGPGMPANWYGVSADVTVVGQAEVAARVMIPDSVELVVGAPHRLVEPATVDAKVVEGMPRPAWTIFAAGLVQAGQPEQAPPTKQHDETAVAVGRKSADASVKTTIGTKTADGDDIYRHKLNILIDALRQAAKNDKHHLVLRLLEADKELLSTDVYFSPKFRHERGRIEEYRRRARAYTVDNRSVQMTVRDRALHLNLEIKKAKDNGNVAAVRGYVTALGTVLSSAPGNLNLRYQYGLLDEHEKWLRQHATALPKSRVGASPESKRDRSRLRSLVDRLRNAQQAGRTDGAQALFDEAKRLLERLPPEENLSYERGRLDQSAQWLTASQAEENPAAAGSSKPIAPAATSVVQTAQSVPPPLERAARLLADRMRPVMLGVARAQTTIDWPQLSRHRGHAIPTPWEDPDLWISAIIQLDEPADLLKPMLSALVTMPDGLMDPRFRTVIEALGFQAPQTEQALHTVWQREVQRAHAFYATVPRPMPPRLVPRADPSPEQA
ncbi:hypothetical protein SAMN05421833_12815 [Microbispora rosea]|uniref:Competence protein CoiA-like family protein n=1 Tax=Microbispora rosea TaxID=58117 RepID=A0A1N7GE02_9ACTN|nr:hypothetical protein [Microbispora rosea]GIH50616.1 hypothetical protein Mro03_57950 [Microbispora rosea subsp. rosea]SIS10732.1 hypothetical protein SAMN05421833_12815 [Microbispora rosea]